MAELNGTTALSGTMPGAAPAAPPRVHPELVNLAEKLEEDELNAIGELCWREYDMDEQSRSDWLLKHKRWLEIYHQADKAKNPPWPGSSEESLPILVEACNQFHARVYQAFFPHRGQIVKGTPTGKVDEYSEARSDRVGKHMSWQLSVKDRNYRSRKDTLLMGVPLHGSVFTKAYHDPISKRNVVDNVRAEDFVVPYGNGPRELESIERTTEIIYLTVEATKRYAAAKFFTSPCEKFQTGNQAPTKQSTDRIEGFSAPFEEGDAKVLEQHRLLDLDNDGIAEPYIVWIDAQTHKVKRLTVRYDTAEDGQPLAGKTPILYYTHWQFLPNPDGFYGLGLGHLLGHANSAVNKMLRQTIDAGTLANTASGFVSAAASVRGGEINLSMGRFPKIEGIDDLSRGIWMAPFRGPDPTIFNVLGLVATRADRLASVTEALTGSTDKVMQPSTVLALIDQGLQVYSAIYERLLGSWERELDLIYGLNAKHLEPQEYFAVLDLEMTPETGMVFRSDYSSDMQIKPIADPKMSTEQKRIARAEALYQFALSNPMVANNPMAFWECSRRYLEALEIQGLDRILPPPAEQPGPPRVDDPQEENFYALLPIPKVPPVFPDQHHLKHLQSHEAFLLDPQYGQRMTPEGQKQMMDHVQTHVAFAYAATETDMLERDEVGQRRDREMASASGNGMAVQGTA
jgi:chaperonin GroES